MPPQRLPFIDWMKAAGMALIVLFHVSGPTITWTPPPVYVKQFGVAFFSFVMGFTLARETRPPSRVLFNRAFEILLFGLVFALCMSAISLAWRGTLQKSNYLPLVGLNIIQNDFPANPTTWYIGTYLHLLVLWAVALRGRRIGWPLIVAVAVAEIIVRAVAIRAFGLYVSYMLLTNWTTVLLLGMRWGQKAADAPRRGIVPAVLFIALWPMVFNPIGWEHTFPFMSAPALTPARDALLVSSMVTLAYAGYTLAGFALLGRLPAHKAAAFFSRNTIGIFIAHMPLFYFVRYELGAALPVSWVRTLFYFLVCFVGLAFASEALRRAVDFPALRDRMAERLFARRASASPLPLKR